MSAVVGSDQSQRSEGEVTYVSLCHPRSFSLEINFIELTLRKIAVLRTLFVST